MGYGFTPGMLMAIDGGGGSLRFQWNPVEVEGPVYRMEYAAIKVLGREAPFLEFANGDIRHIRFDLEFSGQGRGVGWVRSQVSALEQMCQPYQVGAGFRRPPRVKLIVGTFLRKTCVVAEMTPRYSGVYDPATIEPYYCKVGLNLFEFV